MIISPTADKWSRLTESVSKGAQHKWQSTDGKYYLKEQFQESGRFYKDYLVEEISSRLCHQLNLGSIRFAEYRSCQLSNGNWACISKNFLMPGESLYTFEKIGLPGYHCLNTIEEQFSELNSIPCENLSEYLATIFLVDYLLSNTDRHLNNLAVCKGVTGRYYGAPLFDFGRGLLECDSELDDVEFEDIDLWLQYQPYLGGFDQVLELYQKHYDFYKYLPRMFDVTGWKFPSMRGFRLFCKRCTNLGVGVKGDICVVSKQET